MFGAIQRRLACPCANVDTRQSRNVVKFCVAQCFFSFFFSRVFGIVVAAQFISPKPTEWYDEEIAQSISGDAAELEADLVFRS